MEGRRGTGLKTALLYYGLRGKLCGGERERGMQIRYPETFRYKISVREQDFCHYLSRMAKMELKLHLKLLIPFKKLLTFGL